MERVGAAWTALPIRRAATTDEVGSEPPAGIVGREPELAALADALGRRVTVLLAGEPGIGKTTLLAAAVRDRRSFVGGGLGMLSFVPYLPLTRAVGSLADRTTAAAAREIADRVGNGVLVIDDLHWADDPTLEVLARLVGHLRLLAAVRTGHERTGTVRAILASAGATEIAVGPLPMEEAVRLAARRAPYLSPAAARRLAAEGGRVPLVVEELARSGGSESFRLSLAHRLRDLDGPALTVLGLLAVAREPLRVSVDADILARLEAGGFATVLADGAAEVRHALVADVVEGTLAADRRRELHAAVADLLPEPAGRARHLAAAGERDLARTVALEAAATSSPGLRAALLGLAAECAEGEEAALLRVEAGEALSEAGLFADADRLLADADRLLPHGDPVPGGLPARMWRARSAARWGLGDGPSALDAAEQGLVLVAGSGTEIEARLLVERAWIVTLMRDGDRAVALAREALARTRALAAREGPARRVLATALSINQAPISEFGPLYEEAVADARAAGDIAEELLCGKLLVASHDGSGDPVVGRQLGEAFAGRARDAGLLAWEQSIRASLVSLANSQAELERAVVEAEALLAEPLERRTRAQVAGHLALAQVDLGRLDEARRTIDGCLASSADDVDGSFDLRWAEAELALASGDPGRAESLADACLRRFDGASYGDLRHARVLRDWARLELGRDPDPPLPERQPLHPGWAGTASESAAVGLLAAGDPEGAAARFATAAGLHATHHRRGEARCRWAHGEALRQAGDMPRARAALEDAEALAIKLGMLSLLGRIRRSLRAAGARRTAPRARGGGLSAREREVLGLVAGGLTNAQIAARLGVGRPTVARLVANAGAKLGTASRAQAALRARELV